MNISDFGQINCLELLVISVPAKGDLMGSALLKSAIREDGAIFCHNDHHIVYVEERDGVAVVFDSLGTSNLQMDMVDCLQGAGFACASGSWSNLQAGIGSTACPVLAVLFSLGLVPTHPLPESIIMREGKGIKGTLVEITAQFFGKHSKDKKPFLRSLVLERHSTCLRPISIQSSN